MTGIKLYFRTDKVCTSICMTSLMIHHIKTEIPLCFWEFKDCLSQNLSVFCNPDSSERSPGCVHCNVFCRGTYQMNFIIFNI